MTDGSGVKRLAFVDFEASGLGARTWPIEIGWSFDDGVTDSFMISPAPEWPLEVWDPKAEALHGISLKMLVDLGLHPQRACERVSAALAGCAVYSDAPDWDSFWMMRLYAAAGLKCDIRILDFASAAPALGDERKRDIIAKADRIAPRRHRAAEDALHLRTIWVLAQQSSGG